MPTDKAVILIVEDDEAIRESLQELMVMEGYSVLLSENGQHALDLLQGLEKAPSLILLDLTMPVMDGKTFLVELKKQLPQFKGVPILVATAAGPKSFAGQCDPSMVLTKPFDVDRLLEKIEGALSKPLS